MTFYVRIMCQNPESCSVSLPMMNPHKRSGNGRCTVCSHATR